MRRLRLGARRIAGPSIAAGFALVALLIASPLGSGSGSRGAHPFPVTGTPGPGTVEVTGAILYNGHPTATASSASSALAVTFGSSANVQFSWQASGGKVNQPLSIAIQTARLEVFFLGLSVWTKDQNIISPVPAPNGTVNLTADFSLNHYLIEGVYQLAGTLITANGTSIWSEVFYLKATAPDHLTVVNIGLALVAVYEVYTIATVGRWMTQSTRSKAPPESTDAGSTPDSTAEDSGKGGST